MTDLNHLSTTDIRQCLTKKIASNNDSITHSVQALAAANNPITTKLTQQVQRKAAVLVPFLRIQNSWHILFIRRAVIEHDRHSGQVAFAGGKYEQTDASLIETALRETHEEIGIHPDDVDILGIMHSHSTLSNFKVTPIVATINWPYDLNLQSSEVSHTFTIPLAWLADLNNHEVRTRHVADKQEPVPVLYFKEYQDELLWGATAAIMLSLINILRE